MNQFNRTLLIAVVVVGLLSIPAYGEFYQYTDSKGVKRFTDDIAVVPPDQRPDVKIHQSVKSTPVLPDTPAPKPAQGVPAATASSADASSHQGTWKEQIDSQASELDRIQVELSRTYQSLQAESDALAAKAPPADAKADVHAAYRQKVEQLNKKIGDYEARYAEFKNKQKAFYDQYRK